MSKSFYWLLVLAAVCIPSAAAQDRDDRYAPTLDRGTVIPVRVDQRIDVDHRDNRIYSGAVAEDVQGANGRLAIPRGSKVELIVRSMSANNLTLDLESVTINGERYAVKANPDSIENRDNSVVGSIMGAIDQGQLSGSAIRVPRDAVVTFRLARALDTGVPDRGVDREGGHYHDYYNDDRNRTQPDRDDTDRNRNYPDRDSSDRNRQDR